MPPPPSLVHLVHAILEYGRETIYGYPTTYVSLTVEYGRKISAQKAGNLAYKEGTGQKTDRNSEAKIDQHRL